MPVAEASSQALAAVNRCAPSTVLRFVVSRGRTFYQLEARRSLSRTVTRFITAVWNRTCSVPEVWVYSVDVTVGAGAGDLVLNEAIQINSSR